jgi:hypothetical protein
MSRRESGPAPARSLLYWFSGMPAEPWPVILLAWRSKRLRGSITWRPHVRQRRPMSAPMRVTSHSNPPQGCTLRISTLSPTWTWRSASWVNLDLRQATVGSPCHRHCPASLSRLGTRLGPPHQTRLHGRSHRPYGATTRCFTRQCSASMIASTASTAWSSSPSRLATT